MALGFKYNVNNCNNTNISLWIESVNTNITSKCLSNITQISDCTLNDSGFCFFFFFKRNDLFFLIVITYPNYYLPVILLFFYKIIFN